MRTLLLLILLCLAPATSAVADERPVVRWLYNAFPPGYILEGPFKGQGYSDQMVDYLAGHLQHYSHVRVKVDLVRALNQMRTQDGICSAGLFRTPEREKYITFSAPAFKSLPNRIIALQRDFDRFSPYLLRDGAIDLSALLDDVGLRYGVSRDRHYSTVINAALFDHNVQPNRVVIPNDRYASLLLFGRIGYAIGFPSEASFQFRNLKAQNAYITIPIAGEPRLVDGYISCSDRPLGRSIIGEIDQIISGRPSFSVFQDFYNGWLEPDAQKEIEGLISIVEKN